jgi:hypothetical protein
MRLNASDEAHRKTVGWLFENNLIGFAFLISLILAVKLSNHFISRRQSIPLSHLHSWGVFWIMVFMSRDSFMLFFSRVFT